MIFQSQFDVNMDLQKVYLKLVFKCRMSKRTYKNYQQIRLSMSEKCRKEVIENTKSLNSLSYLQQSKAANMNVIRTIYMKLGSQINLLRLIREHSRTGILSTK